MDDKITFGLLCFTSFFTLINPLGTMPVFMTMTADLSNKHRTHIAKKFQKLKVVLMIIQLHLKQFP